MTDVLPNPTSNNNIPLSANLDDDLAKARDSLRVIDEGIRTLNGRAELGQSNGPQQQNQQGPRRFVQTGRPTQQPNFRQSIDNANLAPNFSSLKRRFVSEDDDQQQQQRTSVFKRINMRGMPVGEFDNRRLSGGNAFAENDFDEDMDFNQPKPAVASSVFVTTKEVKSRETAIAEMKENEKGDNKTRNKRMFGLLLGTLQRFKQEENGKHSSSQEKRQREVERKLEESRRQEEQNLRLQREKLFEKRRRQELELKRLQRKKAVVAGFENQIGILRKLQNFIQTTAKPQIIFAPAKHTIRTIELQKKSHKRIEEVIKKKQEELKEELRSIDLKKIDVDGSLSSSSFAEKPTNGGEVDLDKDVIINDKSATKRKSEVAVVTSLTTTTTSATNGDVLAKEEETKEIEENDDVIIGEISAEKEGEEEEQSQIQPANANIIDKDDDAHERLLMQAAEAAEDVHLLDAPADEAEV